MSQRQDQSRRGCSMRVIAFVTVVLAIVLLVWLYPFFTQGGAIYELFNVDPPTPTPTPIPTPTPVALIAAANTVAAAGWTVGSRCILLLFLFMVLYVVFVFMRRKLLKPSVLSTTATGDVIGVRADGEVFNTRTMVGTSLTPHRDQATFSFRLFRLWTLFTERRLIPVPDRQPAMSQNDGMDQRLLVMNAAAQQEHTAFAAGMSSPITEQDRVQRIEAMARAGKRTSGRETHGGQQEGPWSWKTALPFGPQDIPVTLPENATGLEATQMLYLEDNQPGGIDVQE